MLTLEQNYRVTADSLVLECDSRGLPSTATLWSRNGGLLTANDGHSMDTVVLSDDQSTHYKNTLTLYGDSMLHGGMVSCDVYGDWVTTDKRNSGRQSEPTTVQLGRIAEYPPEMKIILDSYSKWDLNCEY